MRERIRQKTFKVILPYGVAIGTVPGGQSATGSADRADPRSLSVKAGCIAAEPQLPLLPAPTLPDGGSVLDAPSVAAMLAKAFAPLSSAGEELLPGEMSVSSLSHGPGLVPGTGVPRSGFHPYSFRRPAARVRLFAVSMPRTRSDQHAHRASPIEYRAPYMCMRRSAASPTLPNGCRASSATRRRGWRCAWLTCQATDGAPSRTAPAGFASVRFSSRG